MAPIWWNDPQPIHAYYLSLFSVGLTLVAATSGLLAYVPTSSTLVLSWGLENLVDLISSLVVLWRFYNPGNSNTKDEILQKREKRASVAISVILFILGIGIVGSSITDFVYGAESIPEFSRALLIVVALLFTLIFFVLTVIKLQMSVQLNSRALLKDGYCSLFGTILALSLFLNEIIVKMIPALWWLDPVVSLVVGMACLTIGFRSVVIQSCSKQIPIWNPKWWVSSQGATALEVEGGVGGQASNDVENPSSSPHIPLQDLEFKDEQTTKETEMTNLSSSSTTGEDNGEEESSQPTHTIL